MKHIFLAFFVFSFFIPKGISQMIVPKFHTPEKIEILSSEAEEGMLLPFNNGNSFYFERTYTSGSGANTIIKRQDIWYSSKNKKGKWNKPYRLFRADDLEGENFIIGTNNDGSTIYLFQTIYKEDETKTSRIISLSKDSERSWSTPSEIKIPGLVFDERYFHFHMNPKESILLISMSPSEKTLNEDLYVSLKDEEGNWGSIIHLGPVVNTNRFEVSPYLGEDEKTLYFSSNGHKGFGSADIFISRRLDDSWQKWSQPLNAGEPINSDAFDAYFVIANNKQVFFASSRGEDHINIYESEATGEVVFANADSIGGQFYYRGLPGENIVLRIEDEDGNFVDEVVTDIYGKFRYIKLENEESYLLKLIAEDNSDYVGSKVYFVDEDGKKTKRYILTEDGVFINEKDISERKHIRGVFNYKKLPEDKIGLAILDENGFPLDTIYADDQGNFSFSVLKYDGAYSIVPLENDNIDWNEVEAFLLNEKGEKIKRLEFKNNSFINEDSKELVLVERKEPRAVDQLNVKGAELEVGAWKGMAYESRTIFFDFNKKITNTTQKNKLSMVTSLLSLDENITIKLIGHTDNIGSVEANDKLGLQRAQWVKDYIISKGIESDRVLIESKGMSDPVESNDTPKGRGKNRRVEIEILR